MNGRRSCRSSARKSRRKHQLRLVLLKNAGVGRTDVAISQCYRTSQIIEVRAVGAEKLLDVRVLCGSIAIVQEVVSGRNVSLSQRRSK